MILMNYEVLTKIHNNKVNAYKMHNGITLQMHFEYISLKKYISNELEMRFKKCTLFC